MEWSICLLNKFILLPDDDKRSTGGTSLCTMWLDRFSLNFRHSETLWDSFTIYNDAPERLNWSCLTIMAKTLSRIRTISLDHFIEPFHRAISLSYFERQYACGETIRHRGMVREALGGRSLWEGLEGDDLWELLGRGLLKRRLKYCKVLTVTKLLLDMAWLTTMLIWVTHAHFLIQNQPAFTKTLSLMSWQILFDLRPAGITVKVPEIVNGSLAEQVIWKFRLETFQSRNLEWNWEEFYESLN